MVNMRVFSWEDRLILF